MFSIYRQLVRIADARPDLLRSFRTDLTVHDHKACETMQPGQRWLWVLRRDGTQLFPVGEGQAPVLITHWLDANPECAAYLITPTESGGKSGKVNRTSHDRARELAHEPPPKGKLCWRQSMWSATLIRDGLELAKVSNTTGRGWHAYVGRSPIGGPFPDHLTAQAEVMKHFPAWYCFALSNEANSLRMMDTAPAQEDAMKK